jgi:acid phosphatase
LPGALADTFSGTVSGESVASLLTRQGMSWKSYAEDLPEPGYVGGNTGLYVKRHNPFAYFKSVVDDPKERGKLAPFPEFAADWANQRLPAYAFVAPNLIHDGHDNPRTRKGASCGDRESLPVMDRWLEENIGPVVESEEFRRDGLLMVVFDEGCEHTRNDNRAGPERKSGGGGRIAVVFFGAHLPAKGCVSDVVVHHESALRLGLEALGVLSFPNGAAGAADLSGIFVLEPAAH